MSQFFKAALLRLAMQAEKVGQQDLEVERPAVQQLLSPELSIVLELSSPLPCTLHSFRVPLRSARSPQPLSPRPLPCLACRSKALRPPVESPLGLLPLPCMQLRALLPTSAALPARLLHSCHHHACASPPSTRACADARPHPLPLQRIGSFALVDDVLLHRLVLCCTHFPLHLESSGPHPSSRRKPSPIFCYHFFYSISYQMI